MKMDVRTIGRMDGQKAIATLISKRFQRFVADASAWHCFHFLPFTVVTRLSERWCCKPVQWTVTAVIVCRVMHCMHNKICYSRVAVRQPVSVAARSEVWVCGRSLAGIAGSNPTGGVNVCVLWVLCVVTIFREGPIPRPEESYRVCLYVIECNQGQQ
jgi:hypothetical protein